MVPAVRGRRPVEVDSGVRPADRCGERPDDLRAGAHRQLHVIAADNPAAESRRRRVTGAGRHRKAGRQPQLRPGRRGERPGQCSGRGQQRRQHPGVQAQGGHHLKIPAVAHEIVEQRGGGITGLGAELAGEAGPQPVFGLQRPACVPVGARFVGGDPREHRPGHAGGQRVGQPGQHGRAERLVGAKAPGGPAVGPQQGRAQLPAVPGRHHQAVHLPRQPDRRGPCARRRDGLPHTGGHRVPPVPGLALGVAGHRRGHRVTGGRLREHRAVRAGHDRLGRTGAEVDAQGTDRGA